ncbi:MAG TPA: helix-turn-helix domain-containing protein [Allosphingosinicella sp.]|jgi:AcrR family transcriptional regulator
MIETVSLDRQRQQDLPLRARKKLDSMRRAQAAAIRLFARRGFGGVSMEEVAAASDVSPASLYRYFGTKENLIIWDEDDDPLFDRVARHLRTMPPLQAFAAAIVEALGPSFETGREARSGRLRLIFREPALRSAFRENGRLLAQGLARVFASGRAAAAPSLGDLALAAAAAAILEVAVERWATGGAETRLAQIISEAFECLA